MFGGGGRSAPPSSLYVLQKCVDNDNLSNVQFNFYRLVFGFKPSPSTLGGTIRKHLSAYEGDYEAGEYDKIVKILRDLYVDEVSCSTNSNHEAFEIYSAVKEIMKQECFNLRKWQSNSKELMKLINDSEVKIFPIQLIIRIRIREQSHLF